MPLPCIYLSANCLLGSDLDTSSMEEPILIKQENKFFLCLVSWMTGKREIVITNKSSSSLTLILLLFTSSIQPDFNRKIPLYSESFRVYFGMILFLHSAVLLPSLDPQTRYAFDQGLCRKLFQYGQTSKWLRESDVRQSSMGYSQSNPCSFMFIFIHWRG